MPRVLAEAQEEGWQTVYVDFFGVVTLADAGRPPDVLSKVPRLAERQPEASVDVATWMLNRLTVDEFDPISREPNYKQSSVRIERL